MKDRISEDNLRIDKLCSEGNSIEEIQAKLPWHTLKRIHGRLQYHTKYQTKDYDPAKPDKTWNAEEDEVIRATIVKALRKRPCTHQQLIEELRPCLPTRSGLEIEAREYKLLKDAVEKAIAKLLVAARTEEEEQCSGTSAANGRHAHIIATLKCAVEDLEAYWNPWSPRPTDTLGLRGLLDGWQREAELKQAITQVHSNVAAEEHAYYASLSSSVDSQWMQF